MLNGIIHGSMIPALIVEEYANELAMDWFFRFETNMVSRDRLQPTPWLVQEIVSYIVKGGIIVSFQCGTFFCISFIDETVLTHSITKSEV